MTGSMGARAYFDIMGTAPAAVTVVTTTDHRGQPRGLTATAVTSVSADPPVLLVCIDRRSRTLAAIRARGAFAINFLRGDRAHIAARFAARSDDRFEGIDWCPGSLGLPLLVRDGLAFAECRLVEELDVGDHAVVFARVEAGSPPAAGSRPLMYFRHRYSAWSGDPAEDPPRDAHGPPMPSSRDVAVARGADRKVALRSRT